ncbi:PucR family transcriptional regulator [Paenibacillus agricola]|nr:PucR family transcriptional regulator [Paenibacillus agricola]
MTVEQALLIYPLSEGRLIAGKAGASRIVKSVNVMDAPDITEWIKAGEMLFTTAYIMKDQPDELIELLQKLDSRKAAGLGIKLGRFWSSIPESIIEEANRLDFPLIELPYQFTFSDQMNGLFLDELERSTHSLQRLLDKQKRLMKFALKAKSDTTFFDRVLDIIETPFAVISSRGHVVYNATAYAEAQLLKGWPWREEGKWIWAEQGGHSRIPIEHKGECIGFAIFYPSEVAQVKEEEGLLYQTAEILAYHLSYIYQDVLQKSLNKDMGDLFVRYLNRNVEAGILVDYTEELGVLALRGSFQCVRTKILPGTGVVQQKALLKEIRQEFEYNTVFRGTQVIHFILEDGVFSIFCADEFVNPGMLADLLKRSLACVVNKGIVQHIRLAISNKKLKPDMLRQAYTECTEAFGLAERLGVGEKIVQFGDIELAYLFKHVPDDEMKVYSNEVLAELLAKEPDYARDMLRTLEAFIEHDGQMNETAKHLFIHRNTATYRMEKIGEILGVDFKKVDDLLRLKLAFMFRKLLREKETVD